MTKHDYPPGTKIIATVHYDHGTTETLGRWRIISATSDTIVLRDYHANATVTIEKEKP